MGLRDRVREFFGRGGTNTPAPDNNPATEQMEAPAVESETAEVEAVYGAGVTVRESQSPVNSTRYATNPVDAFGGARQTVPNYAMYGVPFQNLPRRFQTELGVSDRQLRTYSTQELIDVLTKIHPDASFALWNFLRIGNNSYKIRVYNMDGVTPYDLGERMVKKFIANLNRPASNERYERDRSLKKVINQMLMSIIVKGDTAMEMVLTEDMNDVAFLSPVDPQLINWRVEDGRLIPYQLLTRLDIPTFFYEGLDEWIDNPYGRSPILPALQMIMFQLQVLQDLKQVIHNQGYPRFDIKVVEEVLLNRMPINIRNNEQQKQIWLNNQLSKIIDMYNGLDPDDAFVHFDSVEVDMAGGAKGGGALIDPQKLFDVIDNMIMAGLKTLSTILGRRSQGQTESFAKMEIKLYLTGVRAMQEVIESILSRALTLYLNIKGKQGIVEFKFDDVEIRTQLEQEQFKTTLINNAALMRDQGWITQDQAAEMVTGQKSVGEPNLLMLGKQPPEANAPTDERNPNDPQHSDNPNTNN